MIDLRYVLVLAFCFLFSLCGCSLDSNRSSGDGGFALADSSDFSIFTDPDTGVQYWVYSHKYGYAGAGGLCPRLDRFGNVLVVDLNFDNGGT